LITSICAPFFCLVSNMPIHYKHKAFFSAHPCTQGAEVNDLMLSKLLLHALRFHHHRSQLQVGQRHTLQAIPVLPPAHPLRQSARK
jgi:hypothetical protein